MQKNNKAFFLDRDGIINVPIISNQKPFSPRKVEDFHLHPSIKKIFQKLREHKFMIIVCTNQPDITRRLMLQEQLDNMHKIITEHLQPDAIYVCPHDNCDQCNCRKPRPGMILRASEEFSIDLKKSYVLGDRSSDVQAATAAGCFSIFLDYNYLEPKPAQADYIITNLEEILEIIPLL